MFYWTATASKLLVSQTRSDLTTKVSPGQGLICHFARKVILEESSGPKDSKGTTRALQQLPLCSLTHSLSHYPDHWHKTEALKYLAPKFCGSILLQPAVPMGRQKPSTKKVKANTQTWQQGKEYEAGTLTWQCS